MMAYVGIACLWPSLSACKFCDDRDPVFSCTCNGLDCCILLRSLIGCQLEKAGNKSTRMLC